MDVVQHGESPFADDELFFSRTDAGGIIQAGNSVFQRVSCYPWDELIGRPHKLIRHPDMPRGVFWQFWNTLKSGEPIAAYVKNRAKDGRYYWVLATACPIEGGYLSVRFKPSGALFDAARQEYERLTAWERANAVPPQESAKALLGRLAELGFCNYEAFMAAAIGEAHCARIDRLGREPDDRIQLFRSLAAASRSLLQCADDISAACENNEYMPINLQVQSSQLGSSGVVVSAISRNYSDLTRELIDCVSRFRASAAGVHEAINRGLFLLCAGTVQREMIQVFRNETSSGGLSAAEEGRRLEVQGAAYAEAATRGLEAIAKQAEQFRHDCTEMGRLAAGLEVTRIMGKVECARVDQRDGLTELLDELGTLQQVIAGGLRKLARQNHEIEHGAARLLSFAGLQA